MAVEGLGDFAGGFSDVGEVVDGLVGGVFFCGWGAALLAEAVEGLSGVGAGAVVGVVGAEGNCGVGCFNSDSRRLIFSSASAMSCSMRTRRLSIWAATRREVSSTSARRAWISAVTSRTERALGEPWDWGAGVSRDGGGDSEFLRRTVFMRQREMEKITATPARSIATWLEVRVRFVSARDGIMSAARGKESKLRAFMSNAPLGLDGMWTPFSPGVPFGHPWLLSRTPLGSKLWGVWSNVR